MLTEKIAVVSESKKVKFEQVAAVAAALQMQVERDFKDVWQTSAVVSAYPSIDKVPAGYWPIKIVDHVEGGTLGLHHNKNKQPAALVAAGEHWPFVASHECLEMIVDPWGSKLVAGQSVDEDDVRVEYLVEVCDPVQDYRFGYPVNGFTMSDFYTPSYFDPVRSAGKRYSFHSPIKEPREVLENGYLTWHDPRDGLWYQATRRLGKLKTTCIGSLPETAMSIRHWVDVQTARLEERAGTGNEKLEPHVLANRKIEAGHRLASKKNAALWSSLGRADGGAIAAEKQLVNSGQADQDDISAAAVAPLEEE
jgi:hypothetical protein